MARSFELTSPEYEYDEERDKVVFVGLKNDYEQIQEYADCNYKVQLSRIKAAIPYQGFSLDEEGIDDDTQDTQAVINRYNREKTANMWKYKKEEVADEKSKEIEQETFGETVQQHSEESTQEELNG